MNGKIKALEGVSKFVCSRQQSIYDVDYVGSKHNLLAVEYSIVSNFLNVTISALVLDVI